jgi:hypothetical protein
VFVLFPYQSVWVAPSSLFGRVREWTFVQALSSLNPVIFLQAEKSYWATNPERPALALGSFLLAYGSASLALMALLGSTFNRMRGRR